MAEAIFLSRFLHGSASLGGKKWSSSALLMETGSEALGREGNLGVCLEATSCFAVHMLFGEVLARNSAQYEALALLMALQYPSFDYLAIRKVSEVRRSLAERVAFENSWRSVVRRGVHQGLDLRQAQERGGMPSFFGVRAVRPDENQWSSWLGEGVSGRGGICQSLSLMGRADQSASCQHGLGWWLWGDGGVGRSI